MIMNVIRVTLPFTPDQIERLKVGDKVLLSGIVLTARDAAHKRMNRIICGGEELPFNLNETTIFYCGPSPTPPGKICGAIGPTTSSRMDPWMPNLISAGLRVTIGKGERSQEVKEMIHKSGSLYLTCIGGAAAYLSRHIVSCETYLWPELGTEAVYRLEVRDFPVYVAIV